MTLEPKAKTFAELFKEYERWKNLFRKGAMGNQQAYAEARDTRKYFEEEKWVLVSVAQQEIDDCRTSWQNLKDTIPKFDAKISFLETHLKACNKLIDEMQRERGLQKQKLRKFWAWLQETSWRGVSPELVDEFGERFEELLRK